MRSAATRVRGVSLFELLVTVAIVAILAGLALPNFSQFMMQMNVTSNTNSMIGALNLARSEAVKRGLPVAVIANAGTTATKWSNSGWIVQAGTLNSSNNVVFAGAGGVALRSYGPFAAGYGITAVVGTGGACSGVCTSAGQIVFGPTGAILSAGPVTLNVCRPDQDGTKETSITVLQSGVVNSTTPASSSAPSC
jgi:type IV fimbrial biogenesis protein FimT